MQERGATMREINNQNNLNFPKVELKKDIQQPVEIHRDEEPTMQAAQTENLALAPEAVIGRSQVQMSGINKTDNLEADMKMMLDNPQSVQKAVDFFDIAYNHLQQKGADDAYEKAAVLTNAFKEDFLN